MFIEFFGRMIPVYGLMIAAGVVVANVAGFLYIKKIKYDFDDAIIIEAYACMGCFLGAKLLFLLVSINKIDWSRFFESEYFGALMSGGFVFYGGLIGGLLFILLAGKVHKIDVMSYIKHLVFAIPLGHAFGRIGCYLVGCCYGIPYDGFMSVTYKEGFMAPPGIPRFPVQLAESACLLIISLIVFIITLKGKIEYTASAYLILYGVARFVLEFFRGDEYRGIYASVSTSQWISLGLIAAGIILIIKGKNKKPAEETASQAG